MGQKTHPHGLRIGIHRKWNYSWYGVGSEAKALYFHQRIVEQFIKVWFSMQRYIKLVRTKRILIVDLKIYKQASHQFFIFVFYYKLRSKRRKSFKKTKKKYKRVTSKERLINFDKDVFKTSFKENWCFF